jgi:ion channel-forming bestrophin family protein
MPINSGKPWFQLAFQIKGSVVPSVLPRTLACGLFGVFISILFFLKLPVSLPILATLIPNIVLGLLLVFRTNTAYERFWEGRKLWGTLVNTVRNLARQIWIVVRVETSTDRLEKAAILRMVVAFCIATKLYLRQEPIDELEPFLSPTQFEHLKQMHHPALEVGFWIGDYLQQQYDLGRIESHQVVALQQLLNLMVDCLGGCERILRTPIPLAYAIHLKQLLLLYCLSLPFQMVQSLGWWTGAIVALISFTLFGIEAIGIEIENPFGHDPNDLPLDTICATILRNVEELMTLTPSSDLLQSDRTRT